MAAKEIDETLLKNLIITPKCFLWCQSGEFLVLLYIFVCIYICTRGRRMEVRRFTDSD